MQIRFEVRKVELENLCFYAHVYNGGAIKYDSIINAGPVRARPSHVGVAFEIVLSQY